MSAVAKDIPTVVGNWSPQDKKCALAVLLRELANSESKPVVIEDEKKLTVGLFYPTGYAIEPLDLNEDSSEMREMKRRAGTREESISHDELLKLLHEDDAKAGLR